MERDRVRDMCGPTRLERPIAGVGTTVDRRRPPLRSLPADTLTALFWLVMTPLYKVVRRALRDELDDYDSDPEPWLATVEENVEVWEAHDCRMMRP